MNIYTRNLLTLGGHLIKFIRSQFVLFTILGGYHCPLNDEEFEATRSNIKCLAGNAISRFELPVRAISCIKRCECYHPSPTPSHCLIVTWQCTVTSVSKPAIFETLMHAV